MITNKITPDEEWWAGTESIVARRRVFDAAGRLIAVAQDNDGALQIAREHNAHAPMVAALRYVEEVSESISTRTADDSDTVNITVTVGWLREVKEALSLVDAPKTKETE